MDSQLRDPSIDVVIPSTPDSIHWDENSEMETGDEFDDEDSISDGDNDVADSPALDTNNNDELLGDSSEDPLLQYESCDYTTNVSHWKALRYALTDLCFAFSF